MSATLMGFFAYVLDSIAFPANAGGRKPLSALLLPALILVVGFQPLLVIAQTSPLADLDTYEATKYVINHTRPDDYVLVWGSEASVHFLARRRTPGRFLYQYPLYMIGYSKPVLIDELLTDIATYKPKLIIDSQNCESPLTPSFAKRCDESGRMQRYGISYPPDISRINEYIASNYELAGSIGPQEWPVYIYVGERER